MGTHNTKIRQAGVDYTAAFQAHHENKDLRGALILYQAVIAAHPESAQAEYSRSQIRTIVRAVVPDEQILDALIGLAMACFERGTPPYEQ